MAEKKLVPKRRFGEFEGDWRKGNLGEFGTVEMNKRIFKWQTSSEGDVPFYKIGTFGRKADAFISYDIFNEYKVKYPYPVKGDILISASGSIGRTIEYNGEDAYFQDSNIVWLKHDGKLNNHFLQQFYKIVKWNGLEGSTIQRLYNKDILETYINTPHTYKEQQKIGEFFKVLDERIANQERKIAKVKALKTAYLTEMFPQEGETVPKRRFKGFEKEWSEIFLSEILDYEQPINYIVDEENYNDSFLTPVLTAGQSFILGYTEELNGIKKASPDNPVIIFDDFTTSAHFVDFSFKVKSSALKILIPNLASYHSYFIFLTLKNIQYIPQNHERHWISIFANFKVMVPSKEEQQKIGQFFKNLDDQIVIEEKKLEKLKKTKEAYLEEMFV